METTLLIWLSENRPYTHINHRVKSFIHFARTLEPKLGWTAAKRKCLQIIDDATKGPFGHQWNRDRCFERVIRMYGHNDQRSVAWLNTRGEMITASEVYKVFQSDASRRELLEKKLEPPATTASDGNGIPALLWGTRFEPVAKKIYEDSTLCNIIDVSCVRHPVYPFLGASPDGLIVPNDETDIRRYGRLVEFKCPFSRGTSDGIPIAYVYQMQMQMECTGVDECEYVEFRFKQVNYSDWVQSELQKGIFAVMDDKSVVYKPDDADAGTWQSKLPCEMPIMYYWVLASIKKEFMPKDPNWLSDHLPGMTALWDDVVKHRLAGTHPAPLPSKVLTLDI